jgi:hypothetical protein
MALKRFIEEKVCEIGKEDGKKVYGKDFVDELNKVLKEKGIYRLISHKDYQTGKGYAYNRVYEVKSDKNLINICIKQYHLLGGDVVGAKASLNYYDGVDVGDHAQLRILLKNILIE